MTELDEGNRRRAGRPEDLYEMKLSGKPRTRVRVLVSDPGQPLPDLRETAFLKAASKNRKRVVHTYECCIAIEVVAWNSVVVSANEAATDEGFTSAERVYQLLEPGPVVLLTTARKSRANVMTLSWHMMIEFEPPLVGCVVSSADYSFSALRATKECVMAIPALELAPTVVNVGNCSGRMWRSSGDLV